MSTTRRLVSFGIGAAAAMLVSGTAFGELDKDQQKCIDGYNNKLRLVSAQAGKSAVGCVKNAAKGAEANPDGCIVNNTDGKVAGKQAKVGELYPAKCNGSEPIQQGAAVGNAAHEDAIIDFAHDVYGDPVAGIVGVGKNSAKCLQKATQRPTQAFTELVKAHRKCKKDKMKAGTVDSSATLTAQCGTFAQIDAGGKAAAKFTKSSTDIAAACGATEEPLSQLFGGLDASCHASAAALAACINASARCRACEALNTADGTSMDCDIMDDAASNGSCGGLTCTLDNGASNLVLCTQAFCLPPFAAGGTIGINCGDADGNGVRTCDVAVKSFDPVIIPSIGDVCVNPFAGCASGEIDCDGGSAEDVDLTSNHNIGACASNAACATACDAYCGGISGAHDPISSGCEGFCQGGANNETACTADSQCPGGQCVGGEPVGHAGACNCSCGAYGLGAAAGAGALSAPIGTQINVELPSNSVCGDTVTIQLPGICGGITTETSTGQILQVNNSVNNLPMAPQVLTGSTISCANIDAGNLTGLKVVGQLAFPDSTLGDILSANTFVCQ